MDACNIRQTLHSLELRKGRLTCKAFLDDFKVPLVGFFMVFVVTIKVEIKEVDTFNDGFEVLFRSSRSDLSQVKDSQESSSPLVFLFEVITAGFEVLNDF